MRLFSFSMFFVVTYVGGVRVFVYSRHSRFNNYCLILRQFVTVVYPTVM